MTNLTVLYNLTVQPDSVQEELKTVLSLFREKRRTLDIVKTPEIFIEQASSADDVQKWLEAKVS